MKSERTRPGKDHNTYRNERPVQAISKHKQQILQSSEISLSEEIPKINDENVKRMKQIKDQMTSNKNLFDNLPDPRQFCGTYDEHDHQDLIAAFVTLLNAEAPEIDPQLQQQLIETQTLLSSQTSQVMNHQKKLVLSQNQITESLVTTLGLLMDACDSERLSKAQKDSSEFLKSAHDYFEIIQLNQQIKVAEKLYEKKHREELTIQQLEKVQLYQQRLHKLYQVFTGIKVSKARNYSDVSRFQQKFTSMKYADNWVIKAEHPSFNSYSAQLQIKNAEVSEFRTLELPQNVDKEKFDGVMMGFSVDQLPAVFQQIVAELTGAVLTNPEE